MSDVLFKVSYFYMLNFYVFINKTISLSNEGTMEINKKNLYMLHIRSTHQRKYIFKGTRSYLQNINFFLL